MTSSPYNSAAASVEYFLDRLKVQKKVFSKPDVKEIFTAAPKSYEYLKNEAYFWSRSHTQLLPN